MFTGDELIDAFNHEASQLINTIDGKPNEEYPSPFIQKRPDPINIEKWFPIGSKGRDLKPIKMVA